MVPPRFNLVPHRFPWASYRPGRDQSFRDRAEPRLENSRDRAETETCEKRVSRSLEPRLEFRGLYITGHNHRQLSKVAVGLATYPTISAMLQIFATLPVTTATGGKSFSALKYLKNYLRSTMTEDRLNGLAHLYINRDIELARPLKSLERVTDA
jgi:hypothetical protein